MLLSPGTLLEIAQKKYVSQFVPEVRQSTVSQREGQRLSIWKTQRWAIGGIYASTCTARKSRFFLVFVLGSSILSLARLALARGCAAMLSTLRLLSGEARAHLNKVAKGSLWGESAENFQFVMSWNGQVASIGGLSSFSMRNVCPLNQSCI